MHVDHRNRRHDIPLRSIFRAQRTEDVVEKRCPSNRIPSVVLRRDVGRGRLRIGLQCGKCIVQNTAHRCVPLARQIRSGTTDHRCPRMANVDHRSRVQLKIPKGIIPRPSVWRLDVAIASAMDVHQIASKIIRLVDGGQVGICGMKGHLRTNVLRESRWRNQDDGAGIGQDTKLIQTLTALETHRRRIRPQAVDSVGPPRDVPYELHCIPLGGVPRTGMGFPPVPPPTTFEVLVFSWSTRGHPCRT
jgi:hypothetical protein